MRDNALIVSLETRWPLLRDQLWADFVHIAPFVDYGRGWNVDLPTPDPTTLVSIGVGLRWAVMLTSPLPLRVQLEVYWGYALKDVDTAGGDLQDQGLHLQFVLTGF